MDLRAQLSAVAFRRPHVLLAQCPGGTGQRLHVERALREWGWPVAGSPADADLLVITGEPTGRLAGDITRAWDALPAPRARVNVAWPAGADEIRAVLRAGHKSVLQEAAETRSGARRNSHETTKRGGAAHEDMDMGEVDGLSMADRADDRDGLSLDVLHAPLGPVLPAWPAGLRLDVTWQGDVAQHVKTVVAPVADGLPAFWDDPWLRCLQGECVQVAAVERHRAAAHLDSLTRLLALTGPPGLAVSAALARDRLLAGEPAAEVEPTVHRLAGRLRRSRLLRLMTSGLGVLTPGQLAAAGVTGPALRASGARHDLRMADPAYPVFEPVVQQHGDVLARLLQWADEAAASLRLARDESAVLPPRVGAVESPRGQLSLDEAAPSVRLVDLLTGATTGAEAAAVRLVVASLDPDTDSIRDGVINPTDPDVELSGSHRGR